MIKNKIKNYDTGWDRLSQYVKEYLLDRYKSEDKQIKLLTYLATQGSSEILIDITWNVDLFFEYFESEIMQISSRLDALVWKEFKPYPWYKKDLCAYAIDVVIKEIFIS